MLIIVNDFINKKKEEVVKMTLVPLRAVKTLCNPFYNLEKFQNELNRLFNAHPFANDGNLGFAEENWTPEIDVYDSHDNIMIKADLPGMNKDDIEVTIKDNTLIIKGERKVKDGVKEEHIRTERFYGGFSRSITLPEEVDQSKVNATYKDGVLTIVISKREEEKPKQIVINSNN